MGEFDGYDAWKLATPPDYDRRAVVDESDYRDAMEQIEGLNEQLDLMRAAALLAAKALAWGQESSRALTGGDERRFAEAIAALAKEGITP